MILIDARLAGRAQRGIGRYSEEMLRYLDTHGANTPITAFVSADEAPRLQGMFQTVRIEGVRHRWYSFWGEQVVFVFALLRRRPTLVHFFHFNVPLLAALALSFLGIPWIVTIHDLTLLEHGLDQKTTTRSFPLYWLKFQGYRLTMWTIARLATRLVAVSHATAFQIRERLSVPSDRIVVITEGVEHLMRVDDGHLGLNPKRTVLPYLLYVGSTYPHKNLPVLLDAFSRFIARTRTAWHLVIIGAPDRFRAKLEQTSVATSLKHRIHFIDAVDDRVLLDWYRGARAVAMVSSTEGFGLPVLEALWAEVPVIASDIPALREVGGAAPYYVAPGDVEALTSAFEAVCVSKGSHRRPVGVSLEEGKRRSLQFLWSDAASACVELYGIVGEHRAAIIGAWPNRAFTVLRRIVAILLLSTFIFLSPLLALGALGLLVVIELLWRQRVGSASLSFFLIASFIVTFLVGAAINILVLLPVFVFSLALPLTLLLAILAFEGSSPLPAPLIGFMAWQLIVATLWLPIPLFAHAAVVTIAMALLLGLSGAELLRSRRAIAVLLGALALLLLTSPWSV